MKRILARVTHLFSGPRYISGSVHITAELSGLGSIEGRRCDIELSFEDVQKIVLKSCNCRDNADAVRAVLDGIKFH